MGGSQDYFVRWVPAGRESSKTPEVIKKKKEGNVKGRQGQVDKFNEIH